MEGGEAEVEGVDVAITPEEGDDTVNGIKERGEDVLDEFNSDEGEAGEEAMAFGSDRFWSIAMAGVSDDTAIVPVGGSGEEVRCGTTVLVIMRGREEERDGPLPSLSLLPRRRIRVVVVTVLMTVLRLLLPLALGLRPRPSVAVALLCGVSLFLGVALTSLVNVISALMVV